MHAPHIADPNRIQWFKEFKHQYIIHTKNYENIYVGADLNTTFCSQLPSIAILNQTIGAVSVGKRTADCPAIAELLHEIGLCAVNTHSEYCTNDMLVLNCVM